VVATYAVVLFSLLVQAPTLGPLLKKLKVCNP
jgi:NhaP-type Na+/H+ or K+/H+ antiporter